MDVPNAPAPRPLSTAIPVCPYLRSADGNPVEAAQQGDCHGARPLATPTVLQQQLVCHSSAHLYCPIYLRAVTVLTSAPDAGPLGDSAGWPLASWPSTALDQSSDLFRVVAANEPATTDPAAGRSLSAASGSLFAAAKSGGAAGALSSNPADTGSEHDDGDAWISLRPEATATSWLRGPSPATDDAPRFGGVLDASAIDLAAVRARLLTASASPSRSPARHGVRRRLVSAVVALVMLNLTVVAFALGPGRHLGADESLVVHGAGAPSPAASLASPLPSPSGQTGAVAQVFGLTIGLPTPSPTNQRAVPNAPFSPSPRPSASGTPAHYSYTIVRGDTLMGITTKVGVYAQVIIAWNPQIGDGRLIYTGQILRIPFSPLDLP